MSVQSDFAKAVLDPEMRCPEGLRAPSGSMVSTRFNVYRNNVTVSLVESLTEAFPVIVRLVGETFFTAMAREFVKEHPPTSPVIAFYGETFPDWLSRFPPVAKLPYLSEVAQIEQARREAYHASDRTPFDTETLAKMAPEALDDLRLDVHPSVRILTTRHPALAIWAQNASAEHLVQAPAGEVLITRPAWTLVMSHAPHGTAQSLRALGNGSTLAEALPDTADAPSVLAVLLSAGALTERIPKHV